jgi:hypothetical protein
LVFTVFRVCSSRLHFHESSMAGRDTALVKIEAELIQKLDKRCKWEEKQKAELDLFNQSIALYSSSSDEVLQSTTEPEFKVMVGGERSQIRKRGRKNILTVDVVASFDRTKTSSRPEAREVF